MEKIKFEKTIQKVFASRFKNENSKLYMMVWQRAANSGIIYIWANDVNDAFESVGFSPKFVKMTFVEIDPKNMPVEAGTQR